jgi:hypothetical protein
MVTCCSVSIAAQRVGVRVGAMWTEAGGRGKADGMRLLLLLSAFLTSLGQVVTAVRGQAAPAAVAQAVTRGARACAVRLRAARPEQRLPSLGDVARAVGSALVLPAVHPIYAGRRRE